MTLKEHEMPSNYSLLYQIIYSQFRRLLPEQAKGLINQHFRTQDTCKQGFSPDPSSQSRPQTFQLLIAYSVRKCWLLTCQGFG